MTRWPSSILLSALTVAVMPAGAGAQAIVQPLGFTDADRLAAAMRRLAVNSGDLAALIEAGELSLRLDDLSGAASLFARADKIDPRNGRVKAGMASILVRAERPGEALRYYQMAESLGLPPVAFASDRGLAYDLLGEQERAQRDYRLALKGGANDETVRRYALSLGISGKRDLALAQLAPLLGHADRGAWRARAFVLAMAGDSQEASRIATTMMPPGMAAGLQPFFQRLASLPVIDRAFAVHFGEVRPTPERLTDARLTPALPALGPDPDAPRVMLAVAQPTRSEGKRKKRKDRDAQRRAAVELAQRSLAGQPVGVAPPPSAAVPVAAAALAFSPVARSTPTPVPSADPRIAIASTPSVVPVSVAASAPFAPRPGFTAAQAPTSSGPVQVAVVSTPSQPMLRMAQPVAASGPTAQSRTATQLANAASATAAPVPTSAIPVQSAVATAGRSAAKAENQAMVAARTPPILPSDVAGQASSVPVSSSASIVGAPGIASVALPPSAALAAPVARPVPEVPAVPAGDGAALTAIEPAAAAAPPATRVSEDTVLAQIVANLAIPAAELGVTDVRRAAEAPAVPAAGLAEAKAVAREDTAIKKAAVTRLANGRAAPAREADNPLTADGKLDRRKSAAVKHATGRPSPDDEAQADNAPAGGKKGPADKKVRAGNKAAIALAADKKTVADKKAAAAEKALADKEAAEERKVARANPERIWVQVAGGASADALPRAWAAAKAKAPEAFARRTAYTTPLRATNRVLAGPFKTDAEARKFVNQLAKKGVSAFTFTSDKGQTVSKLPVE